MKNGSKLLSSSVLNVKRLWINQSSKALLLQLSRLNLPPLRALWLLGSSKLLSVPTYRPLSKLIRRTWVTKVLLNVASVIYLPISGCVSSVDFLDVVESIMMVLEETIIKLITLRRLITVFVSNLEQLLLMEMHLSIVMLVMKKSKTANSRSILPTLELILPDWKKQRNQLLN